MLESNRTFRVFFSSTFADFKAERDALTTFVFPRLRDLCVKYGFRFHAVDLRWGIREEAGLEQDTLRICLDEIARCQNLSPRPNFVALLGDRYGWRPLPEIIPGRHFKVLQDALEPDEASLLEDWYAEDTNADPPEYVLQPRTRGSEFEPYESWLRKVEWPLGRALERAASVALPPEERFAYGASATHHEVAHGALDPSIQRAGEHVFAVFRNITNLEDVIRTLPDEAAATYVDTTPNGQFDEAAHDRLEEYKALLDRRLAGSCSTFDVQFGDGEVSQDHVGDLPEELPECEKLLEKSEPPDTMCEGLWRSLASTIRGECERLTADTAPEREEKAHREAGDAAADGIVGRKELLDRIGNGFVEGNDLPMVVHGPPGSGKTAVMAAAARGASNVPVPPGEPPPAVFERYVGTTPASGELRSLLEGLCQWLYREGRLGAVKNAMIAEARREARNVDRDRRLRDIQHDFEIPADPRPLATTFERFLDFLPGDRRFHLFIDAIDQLQQQDEARELWWIPRALPTQVSLTVSVRSGPAPGFDALSRWIPDENFVPIPPLSRDDGERVLGGWLRAVGRGLTDAQGKEILDRFEAGGLPLFLRIAFNEARRWRSFDEIPVYRGRRAISSTVPELLEDVLERLSRDTNHGEVMVRHTLGYLAASRRGLAEDEILDLLYRDPEVRADFESARNPNHDPPRERLPVVVWSRLLLDLSPYLVEYTGNGALLLTFKHAELAQVIHRHVLDGRPVRWHDRIARYFAKQPLFGQPEHRTVPNERMVYELPYQLAVEGDRTRLAELLLDLAFAEAKCKSGQVADLRREYDDLLADPSTATDTAEAVARFVKAEGYKVRSFPELSFHQLAANRPDNDPVSQLALEQLDADKGPPVWLRWANKPQARVRSVSLEGASGRTTAVEFSPDGDRVLAASTDGSARLWDARSGNLLREFAGHSRQVYRACFGLHGRRVITLGDEGTLRLWDSQTGVSLARTTSVPLADYRARREASVVAPSGDRLVTLVEPDTIQLLDTEDGAPIAPPGAHPTPVTAIAFSRDGRYLFTGTRAGAVHVWDAKSGRRIRELAFHGKAVSHLLAPMPAARILVSAGDDGSIAIWDLGSRQPTPQASAKGASHPIGVLGMASAANFLVFRDLEPKVFEGYVGGQIFTPDAVSKRQPKKYLVLWRTAEGRMVKLYGHLGRPRTVSFLGRGERMLSTAEDGMVRLWDLERGSSEALCLAAPKVKWRVDHTPDGARIVAVGQDEWRLLDGQSGELLARSEARQCNGLRPVLSPDGRSFLTTAPDKGLRLWDADHAMAIGPKIGSHDRVFHLSCDGARAITGPTLGELAIKDVAHGHVQWRTERQIDGLVGVHPSRDGELLAFVERAEIVVRRAEDGRELCRVAKDVTVRTIDVSPDHQSMATVEEDGVVLVRELGQGLTFGRYNGLRLPPNRPRSPIQFGGPSPAVCRYSPDGQSLFVSFNGVGLIELDARTLDARRTLCEYGGPVEEVVGTDPRGEPMVRRRKYPVRRLAFSPDGRWLAVVHGDSRVSITNRIGGKKRSAVDLGRRKVRDLAVSPDGGRLVLALSDGSVRVMNADTGAEIAVFPYLSVLAVAFRAGGREIVAGPHRLVLEGVEPEEPFVSARAHGNSADPGGLTFGCSWCSERVPLPGPLVDELRRVSETSDPHPGDPDEVQEAITHSRLAFTCPTCGGSLRLSPFVVEPRPLPAAELQKISRRIQAEEKERRGREQRAQAEEKVKRERLKQIHQQVNQLQAAGKLEASEELLNEQMAIVEELDDAHGIRVTLRSLGILMVRLGRFEESLPLLEDHQRRCNPDHEGKELLPSLLAHEHACRELGRPQDSLRDLERAEAVCRQMGDVKSLKACMERQIQLLHAMDRYEDALDAVQRRSEIKG